MEVVVGLKQRLQASLNVRRKRRPCMLGTLANALGRTKTGKVTSGWVGSGQVGPGQVGPGQARPGQASQILGTWAADASLSSKALN